MSAHGLQSPPPLHTQHLACLNGLTVPVVPPQLLGSCCKLWLPPSLHLGSGLAVSVLPLLQLPHPSLPLLASFHIPGCWMPHSLCSVASGHVAVPDRLVFWPFHCSLCLLWSSFSNMDPDEQGHFPFSTLRALPPKGTNSLTVEAGSEVLCDKMDNLVYVHQEAVCSEAEPGVGDRRPAGAEVVGKQA